MQVYLINLDRRQDRLDESRKELSRKRIRFQRISAIDRSEATRLSKSSNFQQHPDFPLTDGEVGCLLSHIKAWREFVRTGDKYCLVLEDDVVVSRFLRNFVDQFDLEGVEADTVRLETYLKPVCLGRRAAASIGDVGLHQYKSLQWGAAAYILGRPFALKLLDAGALPLMPVDHLLFDPASAFFDGARTFQTAPGLCIQGDRLLQTPAEGVYHSDLHDGRTQNRLKFAATMKSRTKKSQTLPSKILRETMRIVKQADDLTGFTLWKDGTSWTIVPFVEGLHYENVISSPVPVSAGQQALQPQMHSL